MLKNWIFTCLFLVLAISCRSGCGHAIEKNLNIKMMQFFRNYYQSTCTLLLYTKELLVSKVHEIHGIIHHLAKELDGSTSTAMSFDVFINSFKSNKRIKCKNPFLVVTTVNNDTRLDLQRVSHTRLFYRTYWLIFMESSMEQFFEEILTPFDLRMIVAKIRNEEYFDFFEVYRVKQCRPLQTPKLGYWNSVEEFHLNSERLYERRKDLEGIVIRAGFSLNYPINYFEKQNGTLVLTGYFPDIWNELELLLNFSTAFSPAPDKVIGVPESDGTWSGLIGMLQRQEIDVAVSDFVMDEQRSHAVDFTRPLLRTSYQIFFRNVGNDFNWKAMLRPFDKEVWITIVVWVIIGSIIFDIGQKYACKYRIEKISRRDDFNLINSGFFFTKAICYQGHYTIPGAASNRIIFLAAYLVAGVLLPSYSAALIYFLTSRSPMRPFDSLQDLLNLGTYSLQTVMKTADYTYFSNSTNPLLSRIHKELLQKIPEDQLPYTVEDGLARLCTHPKLAHFGDLANAVKHMNDINNRDGPCKILKLSREISAIYVCLGLVRHSPYKDLFNHYLDKLSDKGIIDHIRREIFSAVRLGSEKKRSWSAIEIIDVLQVFIILFLGVFSSIIIVTIELIIAKRLKGKNKKLKRKLSPIYTKTLMPKIYAN